MQKEIEFKNVSKTYGKDTIAVENASFGIEHGEFVFVVGKSGSGKSTLLKLMSAQLFPTSGEIWVNGQESSSLSNKELQYFRRQFGIMEDELGFLSDRDIYQNVKLAMQVTEQPRRLVKKRVEQTIRTVGLEYRAHALPEELSGGEVAKALLARAIVVNPKIMIVDEPTANLSPDHAWDMMCLLDELNRLGVTMIVASHASELVTIMKKRVITMVLGAIVDDTKSTIYDPRKMDVFAEKRVLYEREKKKEL